MIFRKVAVGNGYGFVRRADEDFQKCGYPITDDPLFSRVSLPLSGES